MNCGLGTYGLGLLAGAVLIVTFGLILLIPRWQERFAGAMSRVGHSGSQVLTRVTLDGFTGQFVVGLMLVVVWSPSVGPTLGAATTLASQGKHLGQIGLLMLLFGVGAAAPLVLLGFVSRASLMKVRSTLLNAGTVGKRLLGGVMLGLGALIMVGADKPLEARILDRTPDWLTALTTRF